MYIHHLGIQSEERLNRYGGVGTVSPRGGNGGKVDFDSQLRGAVSKQKKVQQKNAQQGAEDGASAAEGESVCCKQCALNSQLLARMMTQSLYVGGGLSSMSGLAGVSALGSSARAALAYRDLSQIYSGVFGGF